MTNYATPGPWKVGTPGPNGCATVGTRYGLMVAQIAHSLNIPDQAGEARMNAALISAAPEMLDVINGFLAFDDGFIRDDRIGNALLEWRQEAVRVLAKIEGKS